MFYHLNIIYVQLFTLTDSICDSHSMTYCLSLGPYNSRPKDRIFPVGSYESLYMSHSL